jgi:DNA (cytosine-5)-methyltransferase 1
VRPRLLDLFCGAGGAGMGYHRAGFEVVGVDIRPQPHYPFDFFWMDALEALNGHVGSIDVSRFQAIHASPPCQRWSTKTREPEAHPDLITPLRPLLDETGLPYVIENVPAAPLRRDLILCGSSFGLGVQRHRVFESNVSLLGPACAHGQQPAQFPLYDHGRAYLGRVVHVFGAGGGKAREHWQEAMGIDWMTDAELAEAIPPAYTEMIGLQLLQQLRVAA